jgi:molybdopterin converting factor small subunit
MKNQNEFKPMATVQKVTNKMIFVKYLKHEFDIVGIIGYCRNSINPDTNQPYVKGDEIKNFPPVAGTTTMNVLDKTTGEMKIMTNKSGEPLSFLVFA